MANYEEVGVSKLQILANSQLNKLKSAAKKYTRATLRITKKNFWDKELSFELSLTTKQKPKTRNAFANNMSIDNLAT